MISRYERDFWDRFSELVIDDPEDKHNEIIEKLRDEAIRYFRIIDGIKDDLDGKTTRKI